MIYVNEVTEIRSSVLYISPKRKFFEIYNSELLIQGTCRCGYEYSYYGTVAHVARCTVCGDLI